MGNFFGKLAVILAIIAGSLVVTSEAAQAIPDCGPGLICYYDTATGPILSQHADNVPRNECRAMFPATSAFRNNTTLRWFIFRTGNCTGSHWEIPPGVANTVSAQFGPGIDGHLQSQYRTSTTH
jgi:hypothetical protein